ncbi:hypothetical protein YTPLAS72_28190 [Nitrospira sp.]|nr:hypothetical protein YTPLAS72_28190 [Nitrospira sp.]
MIVHLHSMNCVTPYPDLLDISTERAVRAENSVTCMAHVDTERSRPMLERPSFAWDRLLHQI